ncbi:MAG: hypothetical protein ACRDQA_16885 [Nocardioidaceae bacterium]
MRLLPIDRPIRISRDRYGDWCWTCWCCPPPACWTTHTAGSWNAVVRAADTHIRTEHHHDHDDEHELGRAA